jgi:hypothetical protein
MFWAGAGVMLLLGSLATITTADSDLWGHLRFGLDLLHQHHLTAVDPYSFTQDRPWINHEWLSELQMAIAFTLGGTAGLALLKATLVAAALANILMALRRIDPGPRIVMFAAAVVATVPLTRTLRPQLWSLLFLIVLCRILAENRTRLQSWLPLLFMVWANCHGGWIVGLGILCAWTTSRVAARAPDGWTLLIISVLSLTATLATPYGWTLWAFLASTVRMGRAITEWQPLWRSPPADAVPWFVAVGVIVWSFTRRSSRWSAMLALLLLAYSSARVVRLVPLFAACTAVLLAPVFAERWPVKPRKPKQSAPRSDVLVASAIVVACVAGAGWMARSSLSCIREDPAHAPDRAAVRLLDSAPAGRLVTFFDWGEYALWHLGPAIRVSMDGRRETVYSDAALDAHRQILEGTSAGFALLQRWRPEYIWLPSSSAATRQWAAQHGYRLAYESSNSFVAVRADLPPLTPAPDSRSSCFPH